MSLGVDDKPKMGAKMATDRYTDLLQQGFLKPRKVRKLRARGPTLACERCLNWHEKGRHMRPAKRSTSGDGHGDPQ